MQLSWPIYLLRPGDALYLQMHSFWSKGCRKGTDVESLYWCHNSHRILTRLCPWGLKYYYLLHVPHINTTTCGCVSAKMQKCNRIHSVFISFLLSLVLSSLILPFSQPQPNTSGDNLEYILPCFSLYHLCHVFICGKIHIHICVYKYVGSVMFYKDGIIL